MSRTFALTIPQLPDELRPVVSNTYLLCRIADTVEDDAKLSVTQKQAFLSRLVRVVTDHEAAESFARELRPLLSSTTSQSEKEIVSNTARIVRVTRRFDRVQLNAIEHCLSVMTHGMAEFQQVVTLDGLADLAQLRRYCYFVAGIVGETLTELFCHYSDEITRLRQHLLPLSIAFGQGLQMTNILKDVCTDQLIGTCWLPRDVFRSNGFDLRTLPGGRTDPGFVSGINELIVVASRYLDDALRYTLMIPAHETGIRRFCLWALEWQYLVFAASPLNQFHPTAPVSRYRDEACAQPHLSVVWRLVGIGHCECYSSHSRRASRGTCKPVGSVRDVLPPDHIRGYDDLWSYHLRTFQIIVARALLTNRWHQTISLTR